MTGQPHCTTCMVETTVLPNRVREFLGGVEPEWWLGHTDEYGFDWLEIAKAYLRSDAGHMDALAVQMLTTGVNEFPVIHCDDGRSRYLRDGNHRASIAAVLGLPLLVRAICPEARRFSGLRWGEVPNA